MSVAWLLLAASAALAECDALDVRGAAQAKACYRAVATASADHAIRAEALWRAGDVAGANAAFRDAVQANPDDPTLRARWGRLFLDVHQEADAQALFAEALQLDPDDEQALLGMATLSLGRFEPGVRIHLARILRRAPRHPEAHLLLSRMRLELGDTEAVRSSLEGLLADGVLEGRQRLDAYALLAAADAVDGRLPSPWTGRALAANPRFADVHAVPAHFYVMTRRYREAVAEYEQAVAVDPQAWDAHAALGINLLRVNRLAEGRRHLERAYQGDPYNALTVNTLRLLDLLDQDFVSIREDAVLMRAPAAQAGALRPYVVALAERAGREMSVRYGYRPAGPVVVELYEHHDDFAVRTAGLPGLGILGATFGDVVVMDGPAAKGIEEGFDWASALWHELAHVYTLGATGNRVSRWFSEGVSVMEEWRHGPTPNGSIPLSFLEALADDRLLGVAELDEGFLRPRYPAQVGVSYTQAGLLCQLIDAQFPTGLTDMLEAYADGASTAAAVRRGLGIEPAVLDERFAVYLAQRFGDVVEALQAFREALAAAHRGTAAEDWPSVLAAGARALGLYPEYVQPDSAYLPLARAAAATADAALLDATLGDYFARGGRDPWALSQLAERLGAAGRLDEEITVRRALSRTVPLDGEGHTLLGDRLSAAGHDAEALEHFRMALELNPHDQASAHLRLAETYHRLGRAEEARRALLMALEIAPRYAPALDLLLTIDGSSNHE